MTGWLIRLWDKRGEALAGLHRFPAALLALGCFVVLVNLDIAEIVDLDSDAIVRSGAASGAAAAIATAVVLFGERRRGSVALRHAASLVLGAAAAAAILLWERLAVAPAALLGATLLAVPLAPYIRGGRAGFWAFLWSLLHAAVLAFVAVIVFCLGLSAIFGSLQYLFGVPIASSLYGHIWSIGLGFVGPLFALSLVPILFPTDDQAPGTDIVVAGVRVLSDFVAVPLLAAYALILHAYAAKILFAGDLPKNRLGWMVLSFGLCTLVLRIVVHPLGEQARATTRWFIRWWAVALVVPLALLVNAAWLRISAYGVTPERYGLALFALFLGVVVLAQVPRRLRGDIRVIPAVGAICLAVASFGPWGMLSASGISQTHRLTDTLNAAGFVADGRLAKAPALTRDAAIEAQGIVRLLHRIGQLDRLRPLLAGKPDDPFVLADRNPAQADILTAVQKALNVDELPPQPDAVGAFQIEPGGPAAIDIGAYDLVVPQLEWNNGPAVAWPLPGLSASVELNRDGVAVLTGRERVVFPTAALRDAIDKHLQDRRASPDSSAAPLFVEATVGSRRIGVLVQRAGGFSRDNDFRLQSGRALLLLRRGDWQP